MTGPADTTRAPRTDDPDDLHGGVDVLAGRDLLVPRAIDRASVVDLAGVPADADARLDEAKIFAAPAAPADWPRWRQRLAQWRQGHDREADAPSVSGTRRRSHTAWAASCRTVFLAWLWDARLYDHQRARFTPELLLGELDREFGGIDGIVLWHAYPVIGLDDRNQFDFYDVPGLPDLVAHLQHAGVRVFLDYNPWDTATRRPARDDATELAATVARLGADGLFLDTLREADADLVATLGPDVALEAESRISVSAMSTHQLSWAQWFADSEVPGVLRAHWLDRAHMQHHTRRWNRDHSAELQSAWVNGCGVLLWDAVFGSWVGWSDRDRAEHRFMRTVQLRFDGLFRHGAWTPLPDLGPEAAAAGVYGARYQSGARTLYALVNRHDRAVDVTVTVPATGPVLWDLRAGIRADRSDAPSVDVTRDDDTAVSPSANGSVPVLRARVHLPSRGLGAVVVTAAEDAELATVAGEAARCRPVSEASFPARPLTRVPATARPPASVRPGPARRVDRPDDSHGIVLAAGQHHIDMRFRRRETGMVDGAWWVDAWKPLPPDLHATMMQPLDVVVDAGVRVRTDPVRRTEFAAFVSATGYAPAEPNRYGISEASDAGDPEAPMTGIDLRDAEAFAAWAGARLPRVGEWLLARRSGRARDHVWQLTSDVWTQGPTPFVLLVGGARGYPGASPWYFDTAPQEPGWVAKLLLLGAGLMRSPALGFGLAWGPESSVTPGRWRIVAPGAPVPAPGSLPWARAAPSARPRAMNAPKAGPDPGSQPGTDAVPGPPPLAGVKVIEVATLFAGPLAATYLADFGADVVKLEHPTRPDGSRGHGPNRDGVGLWWKTIGRNKRMVTADLHDPAGRDVLRRLVADADVLIENFRPGTLDRWDLGADVLRAQNPGLVIARVTAFGQDGPYAGRPGFGSLAEAMSGFAAMSGEPDGPPMLPPFGLADGVAALATALAIVMALRERDRTGSGQDVDVAIIEPILMMLGGQITAFQQLGLVQPRTGNRSPNNAPRNVYRTADDQWLAVSTSSQSIAERVLALVGHPAVVAEPWFATGRGRAEHADELDAAVGGWIAARPAQEVIDAFEAAHAAVAPVYDVRGVMSDPQYAARETVVRVDDDQLGDLAMQNVLFRLPRSPGRIQWAGRAHGADTDQVLAELGYGADEIAAMRAGGAI